MYSAWIWARIDGLKNPPSGTIKIYRERERGRNWLVVSTHLKNISQIGSFPQIGVKIKTCFKPPPRKELYVYTPDSLDYKSTELSMFFFEKYIWGKKPKKPDVYHPFLNHSKTTPETNEPRKEKKRPYFLLNPVCLMTRFLSYWFMT